MGTRNIRNNSKDRTKPIFSRPIKTVKDDIDALWKTMGNTAKAFDNLRKEVEILRSEVRQLKQMVK